MATCSNNLESLPEDCVSTILSYTSPPDACRFSVVSSTLRSAADSDLVWLRFLPSDYRDILSRALNPPLILNNSSYSHKKLFYALSHFPLLLDGGNTSFKLDKYSGKKSYILSARALTITWSNDPMYWSWRPMPESRFQEAAELRTVNWLEIKGKIRTKNLTPNTSYVAYLIMRVSHRGYGLDCSPCEVSVEVGDRVVQNGKAYLWQRDEKKKDELGFIISVPSERENDDGWMEIEIGEFFVGEVDDDDDDDDGVKMSVLETRYHLKGGLIIEGIEVRPKH